MARAGIRITLQGPSIGSFKPRPVTHDFKPSTWAAVLTRIQADIVTRTVQDHTDLNGAQFGKYAEGYAAGPVTLVNTGWMLSHWSRRLTVRGNTISGRVSPDTRRNPAQYGKKRGYVWFVDYGDQNQPARHFVGLTDAQIEALKLEVLDPIWASLIDGLLLEQWGEDLSAFDAECRKIVRNSNKLWRTALMLVRTARALKDRKHAAFFGKTKGDTPEARRAQRMKDQYRADRERLAAGRSLR